jgi:hypothetical protein
VAKSDGFHLFWCASSSELEVQVQAKGHKTDVDVSLRPWTRAAFPPASQTLEPAQFSDQSIARIAPTNREIVDT